MKPFVRPLVAAALLVSAASVSAAEVVDRILVHVNARIITQSAFESRVTGTVREAGEAPEAARSIEVRRSVMKELINEALLLDRARDLDIITTDADVEDQIKRLKEQNRVETDEDFARALAASGLTVDRLREQLRRSMTVQRVVGREVNSKVDLSDDAMRLTYEREKETFALPEKARVAEILINPGPDAEKRAREAYDRVKGGARFEDVVKAYSEGPTKERGGDLGMVAKGELAPAIDAAVFALPPGGVSEPIQTRSGWHVVHVLEKTPAAYRSFAEVKPELLKREQETQFQKKLAEYLDKLEREAVIRVAPDAGTLYTPPAQAAAAPTPPAQP